jgi:hypothetical protein
MEKLKLAALIRAGQVDETINALLAISKTYRISFNKEILLISARYNAVKRERISGIISTQDYKMEMNAIRRNLLETIELIDELDENKVQKKLEVNTDKELQRLATAFEESRAIKSTSSRLRTKNCIAKDIGKLFMQSPEIISKYKQSKQEGIICGLCKKIQAIPEFGDLDILAELAENTSSLFTKGSLVNALAELIYENKLQMGDHHSIIKILSDFKSEADDPLLKNIERTEAALAYLMK